MQESGKTSCMPERLSLESTCICEIGKHLESITGDSVITCDEIIQVTKTVPTKTIPIKTIITKTVSTNFNEEKVTCKMKISVLYSLFFNYHVTVDNR